MLLHTKKQFTLKSILMKHLLSMAAFAAVTFSFAACSNSAAEKGVALQAVPQPAAVVAAQQATIDSMKIELAKQRVVDSMQNLQAVAVANANQEAAKAQAQKAVAKAPATKRRRSKTRTTTSEASGTTYHANTGYASNPVTVYEPAPAPAPAKKGWSAKAKGAVIGAGVGAVGGAIINKRNRGAGAVIGGVGGAAVGTGIGAIIDRKNGR